jgi:hypothetical protein
VAGARSPSKAISALVRDTFDVPEYAAAGVRCRVVRAPDRDHQQGLSLRGAGAARRYRVRGGCALGTNAAGFRSGNRGRRRLCANARQGRDCAGARRRSRGGRYARLCRRLPPGAGCGAGRPDRDLRRRAGASDHRIRLYQPGRGHFRRGPRVAKFVEKPDPATAAEYIQGGYLWNSGNFMFRASVLLDEIPQCRCRQCRGRHRFRGRGRARSRLCHAGRGGLRFGESDLRRLCGDGKDLALPPWCRSNAAGPSSAPGARCGNCRTRTAMATPRKVRPCSRTPATAMLRPTERWSRWKASTIWSWWRRRTPCWYRARRMPTA